MPQVTVSDWDLFRDTIRSKVDDVVWQNWLSALEGEAVVSGELLLTAPSEFHVRWVVDKHLDVIEQSAVSVFGDEVTIGLVASEHASPPAQVAPVEPVSDRIMPASAPTPIAPAPSSKLLARYNFDQFVVGNSNRFAHAAAMAVAEQPGVHYNPLFIYGGAGLGKTHLLHAVGHHSLELHPQCVVRYVTSENFFNEFIDGIRRKRMDEFKARYRSADVLLLDDVQFFEGKEQVLEEFFHTFNTLYESGKQMVLGSDRHPRNLSTLEDRLRSRFEWGLLTDIQPPDVETRIAILRKNTDKVRGQFPEDVLEFIAQNVVDNIRELEGALTRVTAYATLTKQTIDLATAQEVLSDLVPASSSGPLTPEDIVRSTAALCGFSAEELTGPSRRAPLAQSRQIAMYLCRELTSLSLPKIGAIFGGRDHTTVMYAIDKVKRLLETDQQVFKTVAELSQDLRRT